MRDGQCGLDGGLDETVNFGDDGVGVETLIRNLFGQTTAALFDGTHPTKFGRQITFQEPGADLLMTLKSCLSREEVNATNLGAETSLLVLRFNHQYEAGASPRLDGFFVNNVERGLVDQTDAEALCAISQQRGYPPPVEKTHWRWR